MTQFCSTPGTGECSCAKFGADPEGCERRADWRIEQKLAARTFCTKPRPRRGRPKRYRNSWGIQGQRADITRLQKTPRRMGSVWLYLRHFKETLP